MAKFTNMASLLLMVGFANQVRLRSIAYAILTAIINYLKLPTAIIRNAQLVADRASFLKTLWRYGKLTLVPFLVLLVFFAIFRGANPIFNELATEILNKLGLWIDHIIENISLLRITFFVWGLSIVGWTIYKSDITYFLNKEQTLSDKIFRVRKKQYKLKIPDSSATYHHSVKSNILGLKNEYRSASILIIMVNLLLLIINVIDIHWLWFNFEYDSAFNLSQLVHEGTYYLILSTLMSMGILLYYFRKNQNFYVYKKRLIILAAIWIAQNAILLTSVAVRNFHYIQHYGLAYKRIGLIFFLAVTVVGLIHYLT